MNNSTSARKYCAQPAALMAKGQYFFRHKTPPVPQHRGQLVKEPRSLSPMARRKKVRSFSSAACAAKKILLGLQTHAPFASGGRRVRCSQAANPLSKSVTFWQTQHPLCAAQGVSAMVFFQPSAQRAYRSGYFCVSSASSASQSRGGLSSVHVSGEVLSTRSYSWPLVASCTAA